MPRRIYHPIWNFWNTWSAELGYVLGLLCADGNIFEGRGKRLLQLNLKRQDKYLLAELKKCAGGYIGDSDSNNASYWRINGKDIVARLKELGLEPRKTFRQVLPYVPSNHLPDFVRGYFDGDGSAGIYKNGRGTNFPMLSFSGNEKFLLGLRHAVSSALDSTYLSQRPIRKIAARLYGFHLHQRAEILQLSRWMKTPCHLFLTRKREITLKMEESYGV